MKKELKSLKTPYTPHPETVPAKELDMDPISVAKRAVDMARMDYKRIREIHAGPKVERKENPDRVTIKAKIKAIKEERQKVMAEIKATWKFLDEKRALIKQLASQKKELWSGIKKVPRKVENKAVKEAQIALLEAELAYQKACLA